MSLSGIFLTAEDFISKYYLINPHSDLFVRIAKIREFFPLPFYRLLLSINPVAVRDRREIGGGMANAAATAG